MKDHVWIHSRGKRLSAMLHLPEKFSEVTPLIICCHGFGGNKVGYNHLTLNLANYLEQVGFRVLRFDFLGSGDSDGDFPRDTVISGWQEDLTNILEWVKQQKAFAAAPLILYGHSLGGLIVLTQPEDKRVKARVVFAPVTKPVDNFREVLLGPDRWEKSLAGEKIANFYDTGFTLESQFVHDLVQKRYDPIAAAANLTTPLLIVHGTLDLAVSPAGSKELYDHYQGEKKLVSPAIDHGAVGSQEILQSIIGDWLLTHR